MANLQELKIKDVPFLDIVYPLGSIYETTNGDFNPNDSFGGVWERIKDKFLLSAGDTYEAGSTGGEATHTLTTDEMPSHRHTLHGVNTGAGVTSQLGQYPIDIYEDVKENWFVSDHFIDTTGGGASHNNMPPYLCIYVWKRVE